MKIFAIILLIVYIIWFLRRVLDDFFALDYLAVIIFLSLFLMNY